MLHCELVALVLHILLHTHSGYYSKPCVNEGLNHETLLYFFLIQSFPIFFLKIIILFIWLRWVLVAACDL